MPAGISQRFFSYVEIKTKIASLLPFLLGLVYAQHVTGSIHWGLSGLFFASMTLFDMTTTALNNYIDTKASGAELPFARHSALAMLLVLLSLATASGLWLAWQTGPVVLLTGAACFFVGITYTFGPAPISRMPLGEIFSGVFMGFFIPFITVVINSPADSLINISWNSPLLLVSANLANLLRLLLLTVPAIAGIANIMLANNICDVPHDVAINRFTLPYYLGIRRSLQLFAALYVLAGFAIAAIALTGVLPRLTLLALLPLPIILNNVRKFFRKQVKSETFPLSVLNFILLVLPSILFAAISLLVSR